MAIKNDYAIHRFDQLHIDVLRKEIDAGDWPEYQNLKLILEAGLRSCAVCERSNDQGDMIEAFGSWAHVDCAHEYHQSCQVDPTTRHIGETDAEYDVRMERDFPNL